MTAGALYTLITLSTPVLVHIIKRVAGTSALAEPGQKIVHTALPLAIALLANVLACASGICEGDLCPAENDWAQCVMYGLACGAGGAYLRDVDANVTRVRASLGVIFPRLIGGKNENH